jgi:hypothetical protein
VGLEGIGFSKSKGNERGNGGAYDRGEERMRRGKPDGVARRALAGGSGTS